MGSHNFTLSRRQLLKAGGGIVVAMTLPSGKVFAVDSVAPGGLVANAFVHIGRDSLVTVMIKHSELGQGPLTGLTTLVAEELDADWAQMRAVQAPADAAVFNNLSFGPLQGTGASSSIANSYDQMRRAGAIARVALVQAASQVWSVPAAEITIDSGKMKHMGSGKSGSFGDFADVASALPLPTDVVLKSPDAFRLIGKELSLPKLDLPAKTNGQAVYTMDLHGPDMLTVVVARAPRFGGKVASFDPKEALKVPGVVAVEQISAGVAVFATGSWAALRGRERLDISWDDSSSETRGTVDFFQQLSSLAEKPGLVARAVGNVDEALSKAGQILEREYRFPHLAHAPMETVNGVLHWDGTRVRARYGSQIQTLDQMQLAKVFGIKPEMVEIETLFAGGSFGRRVDLGNDFVLQMAECGRLVGPKHSIKLLWTREDDIKGGFYRPIVVHRLRGAMRNGSLVGWSDTIAGQSFAEGTAFEISYIKNGIDQLLVEGSDEIPYEAAAFRCDQHIARFGITITSLRGVAFNHTIYAVECFIDELLESNGLDPVDGRLALMHEVPRLQNVLLEAARMADWTAPRPKARAVGVAVSQAFGTYIAEIAEVSLNEGGEPTVHQVWCAVDCGVPVNPDIIRAQVEGAIGYGLGLILFGNITIEKGSPMQGNFNDYRPLRFHEMPKIEVSIVASAEKPSGIGEPGLPPIGPAVANALAKLGVRRPTTLPMVGNLEM